MCSIATLIGGSLSAADPAYGHRDFVPTPERPVGWRGDGTGVFPGATPPADFDGVTGKNLAWKTPLPNCGNGSPIVVGKQVFVVTETGWPEGQDVTVRGRGVVDAGTRTYQDHSDCRRGAQA